MRCVGCTSTTSGSEPPKLPPQQAAQPQTNRDAWLLAFGEELLRLRPHLMSRTIWSIGMQAYGDAGEPKEAACEYHAGHRQRQAVAARGSCAQGRGSAHARRTRARQGGHGLDELEHMRADLVARIAEQQTHLRVDTERELMRRRAEALSAEIQVSETRLEDLKAQRETLMTRLR